MDTIRFILIISLVMVTMKLWTTWETTYGPQPSVEQETMAEGVAETATGEIPDVEIDVPAAGETADSLPVTTSGGREIEIETDIFRLTVDTEGAGIMRAELLDFPVDIDSPDEPFVLMQDGRENTFVSQGGLLSRQSAPTHQSLFRTASGRYELQEGEDSLRVPFTWSGDGLRVTKTYELNRGSHLVKVYYNVTNRSGEIWSGRSYQQLKRNNPDSGGMRFIYTYTGTVISDPENRYEKISFDDIEESPIARDITNGWIAVIQHYFLSALVPTDKQSPYHYYTRSLGNGLYTSGLITPAQAVSPGDTGQFSEQIYIGPKNQEVLAEIAEGLDLTVDYGMLWFIAKPLFWALSEIHGITGNWGWSIILVTVILKLLFYKLSAAGYRSMANMRRVQPRLMSLKERYKDDRVRMNQAMMQIYKEEKINPFGGCLPILVQIPVFIALYWVLLESIELRHASFVLWLDDLSSPDPYWVLPLIMGATMFLQQKLNPAPLDPVQAKVMSILPIVFTVFFGFFPSGLVLYWVANNTLSILQQWMIMRNLEKAGLGTKQK